MRKTLIVIMLILLVMGSGYGYALTVFAKPSVKQVTAGCPTYQSTLEVILVDAHPFQAAVGDTVVVTVDVVYQDQTPTTLTPQTISFLWTGPSGTKEFDNVPVTFTGTAGSYNYTQPITADLLQAVGQGKVNISVVQCSCADIHSNLGPPTNVNSDATLTPSDNSSISLGPTTPTPTGPSPVSYVVPIAIALLLILALLLLLRRSRAKGAKAGKTTKP